MNEGPHIDSDRLARYLSGEADEVERAAVERWAAERPENSQELERMRAVWELGATGVPMPDIDVDAAWSRLSDRIAEAEGRGRVVPLRRSNAVRWLAAAAIITGLF
ncbi:MAG TPA: hypothetical protein VKG92_05000, partial [Flavobacteriales bacterium]|nr:hypothetical protein [Flavobacteriales bacterium]